ncbi:MAG: LPS export ABC transporter periplasmic protein LptC [Armatimonadetes bacterium]|nr:LPS export ABC transporter periplasmic protein LptC [Armatimonadota bacterium]
MINFKKESWIVGGVLFFLILGVIFYLNNYIQLKNSKIKSALFTPSLPPVYNLQTTHLTSLANNLKDWELKAKSIFINEKGKKAYAEDLKCVFFNASKKPFIIVEAKAADINLATQSLKFKGKITSRAATGELIEVKKMYWDGEKKILYGKDEVKITRGISYLIGEELEVYPHQRLIKIQGNLKVKIKE